MTTYLIPHVRVLKVEEKIQIVRVWKDGNDIKTEQARLGWFAHLEGSWEALCLGKEKPDLTAGQFVTVRLEAE